MAGAAIDPASHGPPAPPRPAGAAPTRAVSNGAGAEHRHAHPRGPVETLARATPDITGSPHDGDTVLARHVAHVVLRTDSRGSRVVKDQKHSARRVGLAVAAIMAHSRAGVDRLAAVALTLAGDEPGRHP